jgi:ABC-2 type transport system permease protein
MKGLLAVVYREYLIRLTSLMWLFFDLMVPLLYLLMFGVGFDKALSGGIVIAETSVAYNAFFLPGVLAMASFGNAINQSYGFFLDRDNGIFYEYLTYPITRAQFLLGKILFQCLLTLVQFFLVLACGVVLLGVTIQWSFLPFTAAGVMLGTAGWFFFLSIFAFLIRRNDTFNTVINAAYFLLMFLSSMFYPLEHAPTWLRWLSYINPVTWHVDALRFCLIGVGSPGTVMVEGAAFALFVIAAFWVAVRSMAKSV